MTISIALNPDQITGLDLSPVRETIERARGEGEFKAIEGALQFSIDYPRSEDDPRELSEIPEVRLWFLRLDSLYPWMPFFLDPKAGEIARYAAMLVPHQFHRTEGIQYNPEALEIFVMAKIFILADWLKANEISPRSRLKAFAGLFGYDLDDAFLESL
jgi:hypothetical protein